MCTVEMELKEARKETQSSFDHTDHKNIGKIPRETSQRVEMKCDLSCFNPLLHFTSFCLALIDMPLASHPTSFALFNKTHTHTHTHTHTRTDMNTHTHPCQHGAGKTLSVT